MYTLITLGFSLEDGFNIHSTLNRAANELVDSFPWLADQVLITEPVDDNVASSGVFKIIGYKPHEGKIKFVHSNDCEDLCPSFAELEKPRAPAFMLDGIIICPAYGFPTPYPADILKPVVIMQATLIIGGQLYVSSLCFGAYLSLAMSVCSLVHLY